MAADAAAAVGPEAGTLAMEAMEATAMAAEVPWASIGTFLLIFRGVGIDDEWRAAREDGKVPAFRGSKRKMRKHNRNPETRNVRRARGEARADAMRRGDVTVWPSSGRQHVHRHYFQHVPLVPLACPKQR